MHGEPSASWAAPSIESHASSQEYSVIRDDVRAWAESMATVLLAFRKVHREARAAFRAGAVDTVFPAGT